MVLINIQFLDFSLAIVPNVYITEIPIISIIIKRILLIKTQLPFCPNS